MSKNALKKVYLKLNLAQFTKQERSKEGNPTIIIDGEVSSTS